MFDRCDSPRRFLTIPAITRTAHVAAVCGPETSRNRNGCSGLSRLDDESPQHRPTTPTRSVSFEVALFESREATVANSLGRQPKETGQHRRFEPRSGGRSWRTSFCRRFAAQSLSVCCHPWACAQGYLLTLLRSSKSATSKRVSEKSPCANNSLPRIRRPQLGFQSRPN